MKLETLHRAVVEELCERIAEDDLDHVTVRIDWEHGRLVVRYGENELCVPQVYAASVLYQMTRLAPGSPASVLSRIRTF